MQDTVTLQTAYSWTCPGCQRKNYCDGAPVPPDMVQDALRDHLGLEEWESVPEDVQFEAVMVPHEVKCQCGLEFFAKDTREQDNG